MKCDTVPTHNKNLILIVLVCLFDPTNLRKRCTDWDDFFYTDNKSFLLNSTLSLSRDASCSGLQHYAVYDDARLPSKYRCTCDLEEIQIILTRKQRSRQRVPHLTVLKVKVKA